MMSNAYEVSVANHQARLLLGIWLLLARESERKTFNNIKEYAEEINKS